MVFARFQVGLGGVLIRLLDEFPHPVTTGHGQRIALADVAVTRLCVRGMHAERDQVALLGQVSCLLHGGLEVAHVPHEVVGWHHHEAGIVAEMLAHEKGRQGDRRGGVPADRFEQEQRLPGQRAESLVEIPRIEIVIAAGDRDDGRIAGNGTRPQPGFLGQALPVRQLHEGLGVCPAGHRPQPRSGATGQNHRDQGSRFMVLIHRHSTPAGRPPGNAPEAPA